MRRKFIVTSGPTREWIDPVRYISNASSGYMGYSIATEILKQGRGKFSPESIENSWELVYIAGGTDPEYKRISGGRNLSIETTKDLLDAVLSEMEEGCILVMAAAPADYKPRNPKDRKIKKEDSSQGDSNIDAITLELDENPDILKSVAAWVAKKGWANTLRIGFSAETHELETHARGKLARKDLDWIVGNHVGRNEGFGQVESKLFCFSRKGERWEIGPGTKDKLAEELVRRVILGSIEGI